MLSGIHLLQVEVIDSANTGIIGGSNEVKEQVFNVVAENGNFLIIDDAHLTRLSKKTEKDIYGPSLNKELFSVYVNDRVWGTRVIFRRYSTTRTPRIFAKKKIEKELEKRFGGLARLNIDFIVKG